MAYMNPASVEGVFAINELGDLTWSWDLKYVTEKTLDHGRYYIKAINPYNNTMYTVDGITIREAVYNFKQKITTPTLQIPDYP